MVTELALVVCQNKVEDSPAIIVAGDAKQELTCTLDPPTVTVAVAVWVYVDADGGAGAGVGYSVAGPAVERRRLRLASQGCYDEDLGFSSSYQPIDELGRIVVKARPCPLFRVSQQG